VHKIVVMGAGAWGTALAVSLSASGHAVVLWAHREDRARELSLARENRHYLPGILFPDSLQVTADLSQALELAHGVLVVTPSQFFTDAIERLAPYLKQKPLQLAWATKGFEPASSSLLHQRVSASLHIKGCVVSGPTFAQETAHRLPTAIVAASEDLKQAQWWADVLNSERLRVYTNQDIAGVEVGGAMKNIIAIAAGVSDGLGFGANARAALITRGLAEMGRLASCLGAKPETLMGLAGLGDLVLTCTDNQSRNRRFGLLLARGMQTQQAFEEIGQVVEGAKAAPLALNLAQKHALELPITHQVVDLIAGKITPKQAVLRLMERKPGQE